MRVKDLPEHDTTPGPHPYLYCPTCSATYSADPNDYVFASPETVMKCCRHKLVLAHREEHYVAVKPKITKLGPYKKL